MSYVDQKYLDRVRDKLAQNKAGRLRRGALYQDFSSHGKLPGEVFYGNLKDPEFNALPLKTKRKAGPAYVARVFVETINNVNRVSFKTYEDKYGEKEKGTFAVYVHTYELDTLGIEY